MQDKQAIIEQCARYLEDWGFDCAAFMLREEMARAALAASEVDHD